MSDPIRAAHALGLSMSDRPVLIVAGLGRCGMTAMMNALAAGGIPCAGPPPAYEPPEAMFPITPEWLAAQAGRAVKVLDPHRSRDALRHLNRVVLFMRRDPVEQAKSQIKMAVTFAGGPHPGRHGIRRMAAAIQVDERHALHFTAPHAGVLDFEGLVTAPMVAMEAIASVLKEWWTLDAAAAAAVIHRRAAACKPDLSAEIAMIEQHEAQQAAR